MPRRRRTGRKTATRKQREREKQRYHEKMKDDVYHKCKKDKDRRRGQEIRFAEKSAQLLSNGNVVTPSIHHSRLTGRPGTRRKGLNPHDGETDSINPQRKGPSVNNQQLLRNLPRGSATAMATIVSLRMERKSNAGAVFVMYFGTP